MNYKKVVDTAVLAGELMIIGGAEIYRIEDTMNHILDSAGNKKHTVFALSTGITLTIWVDDETITVSKRVSERDTNMNYIDKVNMISRQLSSNLIDIDCAYDKLINLRKEVLYRNIEKFSAFVVVCLGFAMLFGGSLLDTVSSAITGFFVAVVYFYLGQSKINSFVKNMISTFALVLSANILKYYIFKNINLDLVVIGAIMPLVPGMSFTTAMRDILYGDYISGMGRMIEAIVIALGIATGAGIAIWFVHLII